MNIKLDKGPIVDKDSFIYDVGFLLNMNPYNFDKILENLINISFFRNYQITNKTNLEPDKNKYSIKFTNGISGVVLLNYKNKECPLKILEILFDKVHAKIIGFSWVPPEYRPKNSNCIYVKHNDYEKYFKMNHNYDYLLDKFFMRAERKINEIYSNQRTSVL